MPTATGAPASVASTERVFSSRHPSARSGMARIQSGAASITPYDNGSKSIDPTCHTGSARVAGENRTMAKGLGQKAG